MAKRLDLNNVDIFYGDFHAVKDVNLHVPPRSPGFSWKIIKQVG